MRGQVSPTYQRGRHYNRYFACRGRFVVIVAVVAMQTINVACTAVVFFLSALHSTAWVALLLPSFSAAVLPPFPINAGVACTNGDAVKLAKGHAPIEFLFAFPRSGHEWVLVAGCRCGWRTIRRTMAKGGGSMRGDTPATEKSMKMKTSVKCWRNAEWSLVCCFQNATKMDAW